MKNTNLLELIEFPDNIKIKREKDCDCKRRYINLEEAENAVVQFRSSILFSTMNSYYCKEHTCYHLGHNRYMEKQEILTRDQFFTNKLVKS